MQDNTNAYNPNQFVTSAAKLCLAIVMVAMMLFITDTCIAAPAQPAVAPTPLTAVYSVDAGTELDANDSRVAYVATLEGSR